MAQDDVQIKVGIQDNATPALSKIAGYMKAARAEMGSVTSGLIKMDPAAAKAATSLSFFNNQTSKIVGSIGSLAARLAPAAIAIGTVTWAFGKMRESIALAGQIQDMSDKLGVSTTLLQQFSRAGIQTGVDVNAMTMALKTFQVAQYQASIGTKSSVDVFKNLGLAVSDDVEGGFRSALESLKKIQNQSERTAMAVKLFGRGAIDILPLVNNLDLLKNKMGDMSEDEIATLDTAQDAWKKWGKTVGNVLAKATVAIYDYGRGKRSGTFSMSPGVSDVAGGPPKKLTETEINERGSSALLAGIEAKDQARSQSALFASVDSAIDALDRIKEARKTQVDTARAQWAEQYETSAAFVSKEKEIAGENADNWIENNNRRMESLSALSQFTLYTSDDIIAANERENAARQESLDATIRAGHSVMNLGKMIIASQRGDANEKKGILKGMAVADAAGAAVKGIYDVWQGEGEVWYKIAMTAVTAADIIASAWTQISSIDAQTFARGGIVGGNSYSGDRVPARVNSGEMIINQSQQARLWAAANGGGGGVNLTLNVPTGANITDKGAGIIADGMEQLGRALLKADRAGYLQDWKSQLRMAA